MCCQKKGGHVLYVLSYGINICGNNKRVGTIHAEINAIENLPTRSLKKKLEKINILVIRTSENGKLGISKPCFNCLHDFSIIPQKKGYIVKNIFYSNNEGSIENTTLKKLIDNGNYHITRFYRGCDLKI